MREDGTFNWTGEREGHHNIRHHLHYLPTLSLYVSISDKVFAYIKDSFVIDLGIIYSKLIHYAYFIHVESKYMRDFDERGGAREKDMGRKRGRGVEGGDRRIT